MSIFKCNARDFFFSISDNKLQTNQQYQGHKKIGKNLFKSKLVNLRGTMQFLWQLLFFRSFF